jgi:hypothetical protein
VMKVLGANYFPNYDCDKMDLVLVWNNIYFYLNMWQKNQEVIFVMEFYIGSCFNVGSNQFHAKLDQTKASRAM